MITADTHPPVSIDLGKDEPGMTLQYRDRLVCRNVSRDGEVAMSPVDIDALPFGVYRLIERAASD